ncbi:MAG TPA: hypothetical protein VGF63_08220 [Solirubrobacteraceae bacterium]
MQPAGPPPRYSPREARLAAISAGADEIVAELKRAPLDEHFTLVLLACARGGQAALERLCDAIEKPSSEPDEIPVLALLEAVRHPEPAARAVRSAVWVMAAQRIAETWPDTCFEVLALAREAMPLDTMGYERMHQLTSLVATAIFTADGGEREGLQFQFSRESLENVIGDATGRRPARRDMLHVIPHWKASFIAGIAVCDRYLREVGQASPAQQP